MRNICLISVALLITTSQFIVGCGGGGAEEGYSYKEQTASESMAESVYVDSDFPLKVDAAEFEGVIPVIPSSILKTPLPRISEKLGYTRDEVVVDDRSFSLPEVDRLIESVRTNEPATPCSGVDKDDLESMMQFNYMMSSDFAAKAGFIADASMYFGKILYVYDFVFWKNCYVNSNVSGRCEVGVRMIVSVDQAKASGGLSLPTIAASVEKKELNVTASFQTIGMSGKLVAAQLPQFTGEYNVYMHVRFMEAVEKMKNLVYNDSVKITPQYIALVKTEEAEYERSLITAHALKFIAEGENANEAIKELENPKSNYAIEIIRKVYRERCDSDNPDNVCKEKARLLFKKISVPF